MFTDTGSGEVNEATLILNAVDGQFIKTGINSQPKIEQYDRIRIQADDGFSAAGTQRGSYDKYFFVMKKQPIKSKDEGVRLQLELLGTESFLQRVQYTKPIFFETPWAVFKDIGDLYNANRPASSTVMPVIDRHDDDEYNKLPINIENVYEFGVNEDTCFDRMSDVIDSMGASYSAGGVLNFFDLKFDYDDEGLKIISQVFSSGNETAESGGVTTEVGDQAIVTVDNSTSVNVGETDGGIDAKTGTQVLAWGSTDSGSLPTDFSKFYAKQQFLNLFFPNWVSGQSYGEDSRVSYTDGTVRKNYISDTDSNTSTPPTNWTQATPASYYGDEITYSPWTGGKTISTTLPGDVTLYLGLNIWKDGAANPTGAYGLTAGGRPMFWDHNLVINDGTFWRTYVDVKSQSDNVGLPGSTTHGEELPPEYLYDNTRGIGGFALYPYRGFRVLCTGDPIIHSSKYFGYDKDKDGGAATSSTVVDVNKKLIANSVLQYDGAQWKVFARPYEDQFNDNDNPIGLQVANIEEGKMYKFETDPASGDYKSWINYTDEDMGNDCFHPVFKDASDEYVIKNLAGVLADWSGPTANPLYNKVPVDVDESDGPYSNDTGNGPPWDTTNADSAIGSGFSWHPTDELYIDKLGGDLWGETEAQTRNSIGYYSTGAWLSLKFPLPNTCQTQTTDATPGTYVGDIYGGGTNTNNPHEPTTVDIQNMHQTHTGERGFNNSTAEDFGQINSISFNIMVTYQQDVDGDLLPFGNTFTNVFGEAGANFKMRCCLIDTDDNVVIQDFTVFFNNFWQAVSLPITGFEIFKGREPRYANSVYYSFMQPKGIDVQNIFVWRNLKMMSIYTLDPYDEVGRYSPMQGRYCSWSNTLENRSCSIVLDALRFTKPLLASTGEITSGDVVESDFLEKPEIGNYEQLKADAEVERQKALFQRVEYDVTTTGKIDIGFGDYFNLADSEIIPAFTDPTESAGSVKLVAKRIEYSISKPLNGKGGFLRRIRGVRRFT